MTSFGITVRDSRKMEQMEKVQRRATKLVNAIRHIPYQKRLQILDLPYGRPIP